MLNHVRCVLLFICLSFSGIPVSKAQLPIIPQPKEADWDTGQLNISRFHIIHDRSFEQEADLINDILSNCQIRVGGSNATQIHLIHDEVQNPYRIDGAYELIITDKIQLIASNRVGIFYAIQTLRQIIRDKNKGQIALQKCHIKDWPSFKIRGFMHDVGRNYQSLDLLKEQIDRLAFYKYSVFHMHLTDNPGWRLESKIYPQLQNPEVTSRKPGKYYSQEEFIEFFEYCEDRHITIIPELDVPGHTEAFRKAFGLESMNSSEVQQIIIKLVDELCSLVPADRMPYIHLGTDEARKASEIVEADFMAPIIKRIEQNGRTYISWWHGIKTPGDSLSVKQLWAKAEPLDGHPMIDSRSNYVNHLDPLAGMYRLYSQQPCRVEHGDDLHLGGILCCWPDNRVDDERNILKQNPVYPSMLFYSDAIWNSRSKNDYEHWAIAPEDDGFAKLEDAVVKHRDLFFSGIEFPYLEHSHIPWRMIGPLDHGGDTKKSFQVENELKDSYNINGKVYSWWEKPVFGGTVHIKHFFGFPSHVQEKVGTVYATTSVWSPRNQEVGFWIGFHNWSRSGGRRGGPAPQQGEWHHTQPRIWIAGKEILPPTWENPGLGIKTPEIPFSNEDYYYREPSKVHLQKGWNRILVKVPNSKRSFKWMFTCIPVEWDGINAREIKELKYSIAND